MQKKKRKEKKRKNSKKKKEKRERGKDYLLKVRCVCRRESAGRPGRDTWTRLPQLYLVNKETQHAKVIPQLWGTSTDDHTSFTPSNRVRTTAYWTVSDPRGSNGCKCKCAWDSMRFLRSLHAHCAKLWRPYTPTDRQRFTPNTQSTSLRFPEQL